MDLVAVSSAEEKRQRNRLRMVAWRAAHPEEARAASRKQAIENPEKNRANVARWKAANLDHVRERGRAAHHANREKRCAYFKAWREANAERKRAKDREYRKTHIEKARLRDKARKAARYAICLADAVSPADWRAILSAWDGACAYCGEPATSMDHMTPLARGGKHEPSNVVPACGRCNSSKAARMPLDFIWKKTRVH